MAHQVFISYSNRDEHVAKTLCNWLESNSIKCWAAWRDIPPGETWAGSIVDAIENASVMILVFSLNANKSTQVLREVELAINNGVMLIPLRIEDVMPTGSMSYYLATMQWVDVLDRKIESKAQIINDKIQSILGTEDESKKQEQPVRKDTPVKDVPSESTKRPVQESVRVTAGPDRETGSESKAGAKTGKSVLANPKTIIGAVAAMLILAAAIFLPGLIQSDGTGSEAYTAADVGVDPNMVVNFQDETLKDAIRDTLSNMGEPVGTNVTVSDMLKLDHLMIASSNGSSKINASGMGTERLAYINTVLITTDEGIEDFEGLQYARNLTDLLIVDAGMAYVTILSELDRIQILTLCYNEISDIEFLENMTSLIQLNLSDNEIKNVEVVGGLENLQALNLAHNDIDEGVQAIAELEQLDILFIDQKVYDQYASLVSGLGDKGVNVIPIESTVANADTIIEIEDEGFKEFIVATLEAMGENVQDGVSIEEMMTLRTLAVTGPGCELDCAALGEHYSEFWQYTGLNSQDCYTWGEGFDNLEALEYAQNLEALLFTGFGGFSISGLEPFTQLENMKYLFLPDNEISDISALEGLDELETLNLADNQISDVSPLSSLDNVEMLFLANNNITDVSALADMDSLEYLELRGNPVSDLSSLKACENLTVLHLDEDGINDIGELDNLD